MPNNLDNSSNSGYYQPSRKPFNPEKSLQQFVNRTNGVLSVQILDGINNLINTVTGYYGEQLNIAGEDAVWLRRKTSGQVCPNILAQGYGNAEEQCAISKCPICFGTTFVGGYDDPIILKMSFNPQKADIVFEQAGLVVKQQPTGWTIDTDPIMKEMDMIVTYNNVRYLVATQESEEKQGKRVYQRLTFTKPDVYDVAYEVPVPTIYGDAYKDFRASIIIRGHTVDFPATIHIFNYYWHPVTGNLDEEI